MTSPMSTYDSELTPSQEKMLDCIVVGSGPAGGSAAYHLAKLGRSVLVIDRATLPRYKVCSGGVSPAVGAWFDFDFSPVISKTVKQIRYTWKVGDPVDATLNTTEPMWMVNRSDFDHYIIQQAQALGAQVQTGTTVTSIEFKGDFWTVNTDRGTFQAKYLVAADGAKGPMAQWLGFGDRNVRMGMVMEVPSQDIAPTAQFDFGIIKNGFIWSLPKANGYSIGTGTFRGKDNEDLKAALLQYAKLKGLSTNQATFHSHPMCLWTADQQLHARNALLTGEAAGLSDPFTAEGIRPALFSGMKAALAIDETLSGNRAALANYTQVIQAEWGQDMVWAQKLANIFYRVPGIGYKVGVKRQSATDRLCKIMCGELKYADVATRALKKLSGGLIPGLG